MRLTSHKIDIGHVETLELQRVTTVMIGTVDDILCAGGKEAGEENEEFQGEHDHHAWAFEENTFGDIKDKGEIS